VTGQRQRALRRAVVMPIKCYQLLISPLLGQRCRYEPSCSRYAVEAVEAEGVMRGLVLSAWRLLRCNPFSRGGYDPVSAQGLFHRTGRPAGA